MADSELSPEIEYRKQLEKAQKYISFLYPDYGALDPADRIKVSRNESFIYAHTDLIDKMYKEIEAYGAELDSQKTMEYVLRTIKERVFTEMLHPGLNTPGSNYPPEQLDKAMHDSDFISSHLDEVEESFYDLEELSKAMQLPDKQRMEMAMDRARSLKISPNQIGKRTFYASPSLKKDVKNVEKSEMRDKSEIETSTEK